MANASKAASVSPRRRALLGKVHVARKELRLTEENYRDRLMKVTGHDSAAKCSDEQLVRLLDDFRDVLKWQAKPKKPVSASQRRADHPSARKARALWISLGQLGAIADGSEKALEEFAKRQLKCERLVWADQGQMSPLIEALTAIAERHGWDAKGPTEMQLNVWGVARLKVIKGNLVLALLAKLKAKGYAAEDWSVGEAAERICGETPQFRDFPNHWTPGEQEAVTQAFAHLLKTGRRDGMGED